MSEGEPDRRSASVALVVAVCLVAMNMRPTITAVGPILDQIGADTGMATATLGFVAAVPLLAWAIVSPFALALSRRFGMSRVVLASLVLLAIGTIVRSLPPVTDAWPAATLWLGTLLIGVALAIANVLMPAVVKRDFPGRTALMMAVYTALLGGFGALASGVAVPLSQLGDGDSGWRIALFVTGMALLPFAIGAWAWATRGHHAAHLAAAPSNVSHSAIWRDRVAWQVAAYMGFQASVFYMLLTWLAAIATSIGLSPVVAGIDVMVFQLLSLAGSLVVPVFLRGRAQRWVPAAIPVLAGVGLVGLMLAPDAILVWCVVVGLSSGASLSMSLTLFAQRARDHDASAALSGMAQSVGYVMAACGPVLFGWLHAATGGWNASIALVIAVTIGQCVSGLYAGRDRFVLDAH